MRTVTFPLLAVLGLCGVPSAQAADLDYDYLRGAEYDPIPAPVAIDWTGVYVGGHGGYTSGGLSQARCPQSTSRILAIGISKTNSAFRTF